MGVLFYETTFEGASGPTCGHPQASCAAHLDDPSARCSGRIPDRCAGTCGASPLATALLLDLRHLALAPALSGSGFSLTDQGQVHACVYVL